MKKVLSVFICAALAAPMLNWGTAVAEGITARQVEYLGRGGYGVKLDDKVYLSWRLLGTEPINQTFDVYRDGSRIAKDLDRLYYEDSSGTSSSVYQVVPAGETTSGNDKFIPYENNYFDIIVDKPGDTYIMYDASVGDVDNDGQYEFIVKWDPENRRDNGSKGKTDNVYIDCYKMDGTKLWRIDMGQNIRAGAHYTQFIVYDFDGDGKAEMAVRTAPGSKDSKGNYVSTKGAAIDGTDLLWTDSYTGETVKDTDWLRNGDGHIIKGPDWLTMFNGETGEAMQTVNYYPQRGNVNDWGDNYGNRSERYLGGVAYLDGVHPSLIMSRGYYKRAAMAAYDWDGKNFSIRWTRDDTTKNKTLYGNGNHSLSVCDADNDGRDEIVFGSTVVDDDGSILNSTDHGHGDALHASDFNNDGEQEIFSVHEEAEYYKEFGAETRKAKDGAIISSIPANDDVGRGLMGNIYDDDIADSEFFSSADSYLYNMEGSKLGNAPSGINPSFLIWWDGSLDREILYRTSILKYDYNTSTKKNLESFQNVISVEKDGPLLSADLLGDWREEVCYQTEDCGTIRVYMTTTWSKYKIPTLMHDTQYRTAVAWQNVGYNQPPHPKFYVGKAAVSPDNEYYLAPKTGFDTVTMVGAAPDFQEPTITPAPEGSFTVNIKATGDISKTIKSYTDISYGSSLSYAFPKYYVENGIAYEASANANGTHYGGSVAHVIKNQDISIMYTKKYSNVVYYEDLDVDTNKSADLRASNCLAQDNKQYTSQYKLQPGKTYNIVVSYQNSYRGSQFMADEKVLHTITEDDSVVKKNNWGERTISGVTVDNESSFYTVAGSNNTYDPIDTVLIILEQSDEKLIQYGDFENMTAGTEYINDSWVFDTDGWYISTSKTYGGVSTEAAKSGTTSVKLRNLSLGQRVYLIAGRTYNLSFDYRVFSTSSGTINAGISKLGSDYKPVSSAEVSEVINSTSTDWSTDNSISFTPTSTGYYAVIFNEPGVASSYIDNVSLNAEPSFTVTKLLNSYKGSTSDDSVADVYEVTLDPNGNTVTSVDITVNNQTKTLNSTTITDGMISFGVIIGYSKDTSERYEPSFKAKVE